MFILRETNQPIKWPVTISIPVDGGTVQSFGFTAHFLPHDAEQLAALSKLSDQEFVAAILPGWESDLVDEHNQPLPFSAVTRDRLARTTWIKRAIITAYYQMLAGLPAKN